MAFGFPVVRTVQPTDYVRVILNPGTLQSQDAQIAVEDLLTSFPLPSVLAALTAAVQAQSHLWGYYLFAEPSGPTRVDETRQGHDLTSIGAIAPARVTGQITSWANEFDSAADATQRLESTFVGAGSQIPYSVATDASGNVFITGSFQFNINLGGGLLAVDGTLSQTMEDLFIAKFSGAGAHAWSERCGGPYADQSQSVTIDSDGKPITTGFFQDTATFGAQALVSAGSSDIFLYRATPP